MSLGRRGKPVEILVEIKVAQTPFERLLAMLGDVNLITLGDEQGFHACQQFPIIAPPPKYASYVL